MRNAFGILGVVCGAVIVVLVSRYGYKSTDDQIDALIVAFLYGLITTFGLGGHAFAVYLWRYNGSAAFLAGVVAVAALTISLSNSLGAIAGRQGSVQNERLETNRKIRAAEAEIERLQSLRNSIPTFQFVDAATIEITKRAADAATKTREAECANRGNRCRDRERDEREAIAALATATSNKAVSDRAGKLEADIEAQRAVLASLGPVVTVNVQGSAIAELFRLPENEAGFAEKAQQFGTAIVAELIILCCLIGWEASRKDAEARGKEAATTEPQKAEMRPEPPHEPAYVEIPKPEKPKLIASSAKPVGSVKRIITDNLESAPGQRVEIADLGTRYRDVCKADGKPAASLDDFLNEVERFCKAVGLKRRVVDGHLYLMDVQLVVRNDAKAVLDI